MNDLFGLSMTIIMFVLLGILAVALSLVGWVVLRNRVMFQVGVRNIPRRRAQTTLIIIGLMLSTLIITAAFSIGDTVDYSITNTAYNRLHSVDELVQAPAEEDEFDTASLLSAITIPQAQSDAYVERIKQTDGVDGALGFVRGAASASNESKGQTEPTVVLFGIDPSQLDGFRADITTTSGREVSPADLAEDEIYANKSAASELDITAGDRITLFVNNTPATFTVKDIVNDRLLTGAVIGVPQGFLLSLNRAQALFGRQGIIDSIAISNDGGVRDGIDLSGPVTARLNNTVFLSKPIEAVETKRDLVDESSLQASFFTSFFVVLGLFSIAAGMMLIFLIFVMLAAERKVEMGMVRAVGTKRRHLVQMFMSEGMVYNVGAAAVGAALGVVVGAIMVRVMQLLFEGLDLSVTFHVSPRSLIVSYSVGVVLTFLTVTFSSWRIGNINIVAAIRDTAEPPALRERPRGGGTLGTIFRYLYWLTFRPSGRGDWAAIGIIFAVIVAEVVAMFGLYALATWMGVIATIVVVLTALVLVFRLFQFGAMLLTIGAALILVGLASQQAGPFGLGLSAAVFGAAMVLAQIGFPARPVYTTASLFLLVSWLLLAGANTPFAYINELDGNIEMFFISGVSMVLAATFVLVYNADLMLGGLSLVGGLVSSLVPSIRTAVAYPLANKFRTGMTIAMISLVMFALVMMSTMNSNFTRIFLSDKALGNYEIVATENAGNPVADLKSDLAQNGYDVSAIESVDKIGIANSVVTDVKQLKAKDENLNEDYSSYEVHGLSDGFITNSGLGLSARGTGFASDGDVWAAMLDNPDYAVIDAFVIGGGGFGGGGFSLQGIEPTDRTFEPIPVSVRDSATSKLRTVKIIGVLSTEASGLYQGLLLTNTAFTEVYGKPASSAHFIRLKPGTDADQTAKDIERTLLFQGVQADSLRKLIDDFQAQSAGFIYLIQGFMGIGLFVGIAAVGVIAFRTVVERRQQIGMLRAIGYTRRAVALSFLMESSFTALLGIVSGIGLALLLAYQLVKTDDFVPGGVQSFYIPWLQIIAIGGFAFIASILMTIIPSRQASSIPIAEALRYE